MDKEVRHLFIEIEKKGDSYDATLSDDSIDRDGEFFSADLIKAWGSEKTPLPFLANHDNSMGSLVGAWTNRTVVTDGTGNTALKMTPQFFTAEASPLAQQIKKQIDEATDMGLRVGLSIGFIPMNGQLVGNRYMHTQAELVEGSAVPVQSNRHASISLAKSFKLDKTDSNLKTMGQPKIGGNMVTLEELNSKVESFAKELAELKIKIAELEAKKPEMTAEEKAAMEEQKKEIEAIKAKAIESETKMKAELDTYAKNYAELKKEVEKPHGRIPFKQFSAQAKDDQNSKEPFNATKAWAKQHGMETE